MLASAEVVFGFFLIFMLLTLAALVGTVIIVFKAIVSVFGAIGRRLLGLPSDPPPRQTARRLNSCGPSADRLVDQSRRRPQAGASRDDADRGPRVYCTNARCGHENRAMARYCARCGQPLASRA